MARLLCLGESLLEIGGKFRIPDVCCQSGTTLVEVGTTNRTYLEDYQNAVTENTAAFLKVHTQQLPDHRLHPRTNCGGACAGSPQPTEFPFWWTLEADALQIWQPMVCSLKDGFRSFGQKEQILWLSAVTSAGRTPGGHSGRPQGFD